MAGTRFASKLKVAVFVVGSVEDDLDAQLCQASLIERELTKVAHVTIVDSELIASMYTEETLQVMRNAFDVVLILTSDQNLGPSKLQSICHSQRRLSVCRWNVSGIDVWVEASKCDQAIYAALKGVDYGGFGPVDLLGPLKSANRMDIKETALPSIYP